MRSLRYSTAILTAIGLFSLPSQASVVGIIDSGLDTEHKELMSQLWVNPADSTFDSTDNDNNGFKDDVHGWNFINNNNVLIERKYGDLFDADVERFFQLQTKALLGIATTSDIDWLKTISNDQDFVKKVMTFGNYAHGTHVTGIALQDNPDVKALSIKLIPTSNPFASVSDLENRVREAAAEGRDINWIVKQIIKGGLALFAKAQGVVFSGVGDYLGQQNIAVANASLGMGRAQAEMILKPVLKIAAGGQEPSAELLKELTIFFLSRVNAEQEVLLRNAAQTLFVFAAGNEGIDNDIYPTSPASIDLPFKISVAATFADGRLAPFSNFGMKVDVAAPGVGILSATPDDKRLELSGTSQAAPFVAGLAAQIKSINPDLNALDLKEIILSTVDKVEALQTKVKAGGVVNRSRALYAAELSKVQALSAAIQQANREIAAELQPSMTTSRRAPIWVPAGPVSIWN